MSHKTWSNWIESIRETNWFKMYKIDTLNMTYWTWQIVAFSHKVRSEQKAKHYRIFHHFYGFSLVYRFITLTHNYTNQVIALLLLICRSYDTSIIERSSPEARGGGEGGRIIRNWRGNNKKSVKNKHTFWCCSSAVDGGSRGNDASGMGRDHNYGIGAFRWPMDPWVGGCCGQGTKIPWNLMSSLIFFTLIKYVSHRFRLLYRIYLQNILVFIIRSSPYQFGFYRLNWKIFHTKINSVRCLRPS